MKSRFSTIDITCVIRELLRFVSMRVMNVYDVDNKTYLIRLGKPDDKAVILLESGIRLHSTEFDWPKNPAPSGFSMKLRKHIKGRRLEKVEQLGIDRIVDLTFGSGEAAYHVIVELYDRGNVVLTDCAYTILNLLRPRTDNSQDVRFAVRETYPIDAAKQHETPTEESLRELILSGKEGDTLKKLLIPHMDYGPAIIEHCLQIAGFPENVKIGKGFNVTQDMFKLLVAIEEAEDLLKLFQSQNSKGYIIQKCEKRPNAKAGEPTELLTHDEFHPMLMTQYEKRQYKEFESFNKSVDEFYSQIEGQKVELKTLQMERTALKKLENVKADHEKRVHGLEKEQELDKTKGQLIEMNLDLVDRAITIVRSAIANQIDWTEIQNMVKEAQTDGDPVAMAIKDIRLGTNHITMLLTNPWVDSDFEDDEEYNLKPLKVDIDLGHSAYANSRKYFDKKKFAAQKQQKTLDASAKALKSAEKKTKETLKEVATVASINKVRKTYWFEKFLWFISSENYLVIGGRDQQQNELLVKRYMKQGDIYVHADLHGASTVIIKNINSGEAIPPKTLVEAGTMAICNSAAWEAKVITSAWWVYPSQVSKTAPSGEYLTTGSFMIRGKKNFLPPSYLVYGFGIMFKLEEDSVARHAGERRVRTMEDDDAMSIAESVGNSEVGSEVTLEARSDEEDDDSDDDDNDEEEEGNDNQDKDQSDVKCDTDEGDDVEKTDSATGDESAVNVKQDSDLTDIKEEPHEANCDTDKDSKDSDAGESVKKEAAIEKGVDAGRATKAVPEFPDTEISLQHVQGDRFELARSVSNQSADSDVIYLGDEVPVTFGQKVAPAAPKLSAKQRREMKKAKKREQLGLAPGLPEEEEEDKVGWLEGEARGGRRGRNRGQGAAKQGATEEKDNTEEGSPQRAKQQPENPQHQPKRGQKSKMKKIKEKYKDQDEEERQLRMELLQSAGSKKEDKKKKGKKGEDKGRPQSAAAQKGGKQQQQKTPWKKPELVDIIIKDVQELSTDEPVSEKVVKEPTVKEPAMEEEEKTEEDLQASSDEMQQILNSLTGLPVSEDELLFAVPVCAPYNSLTNYKYKVKLLPGNTKRGKAVKTALNMYLHEKNITSRERDLLKILKDVDISRAMPGKVKVTAPNLHRGKKK